MKESDSWVRFLKAFSRRCLLIASCLAILEAWTRTLRRAGIDLTLLRLLLVLARLLNDGVGGIALLLDSRGMIGSGERGGLKIGGGAIRIGLEIICSLGSVDMVKLISVGGILVCSTVVSKMIGGAGSSRLFL